MQPSSTRGDTSLRRCSRITQLSSGSQRTLTLNLLCEFDIDCHLRFVWGVNSNPGTELFFKKNASYMFMYERYAGPHEGLRIENEHFLFNFWIRIPHKFIIECKIVAVSSLSFVSSTFLRFSSVINTKSSSITMSTPTEPKPEEDNTDNTKKPITTSPTSSTSSDQKNCRTGLTAKGDQRQYVKHSYTDRSNDFVENLNETDENILRLYRGDSIGGTFPIKLQIVLKVIEKVGQQHIVSWLPHGRSFMIHRPREFEDEVMGKFFKQTKLTSFQRQLNLYDFQRITHGRDAGSYYHELFLRGRPLLAKRMIRRKVKGTKIRASSSPDDEPNFYTMPFLAPHDPSSTTNGSTMSQENMFHASTTNQSSVSSLQGMNDVNDTLGLSVASRSPNGSGTYDQSALHQLGANSNSLPGSTFLNPLQAALAQGSFYPELMNTYGTGQMPLPLRTSIDNLHYSNALATNALQRDFLSSGQSFGASPHDISAAVKAMWYNTDLPNNSMMGLRGLQSSAATAAVREQRIAHLNHLNELAMAGDNYLNSQLLHHQLQAQQGQRQRESQLAEAQAPQQK